MAGLPGLRAADSLVVSGPVIELPKFEVVDSRLLPPPEAWRYAEIPGFEILSRISERETKRFMRDFLLLQTVIGEIMPMLLRGQTPVPTALVLCGGRGKGFDEFLPADRSIEQYGTNSLFFKTAERSAIVIDFALDEIQLGGEDRLEADPYRAFYAAYFRFLIRRQTIDKAPPWFEEGLVQLFAATEFDKKYISFAQIGDGFGASKIGDFNQMLHKRAIMPFGEMLAPDGPSRRTPFWAAQCYAFVHYCLYGWGLKNQAPFVRFVQRLGEEAPSETLFKECFKKSYKQFATELRGYIDFTAHKKVEFKAKKGHELPEPPPVPMRAAADHEVGRIKGEVLRLGGNSTAAHNTLIAPYVRGERDPRLLAALGLDEKQSGNDDRARKFLEAAASANVQRARAYLELARLRLDEVRTKARGAGGQLDADQMSRVLTPLFTARKLPPPMADVYGLIAETWSLSAAKPEAEHLAVVIEGVRMFPRDTALLMHATLLAAKRGFPVEAKALAERGVKVSKEAGDQDRFRMIAAAFERDVDPKPATPAEKPLETEPYILKQP
ncbi:MAG: hypothetical protein EXS37_00100 [Opitutus sp.]|nr:hypothetical protein [Opitutus sp.]